MAVLLCCVLSLPMLGCGKSQKPPAKADPADKLDDMKAMQDVLPPPGPGGQIPGGKK
jgi:hypothetical protein